MVAFLSGSRKDINEQYLQHHLYFKDVRDADGSHSKLSAEEAQMWLQENEEVPFIFRESSRSTPDIKLYAMSYRTKENEIAHVLIRPIELGYELGEGKGRVKVDSIEEALEAVGYEASIIQEEVQSRLVYEYGQQLKQAILDNDAEGVEKALDEGADVNDQFVVEDESVDPLMLALRVNLKYGNPELINAILNHSPTLDSFPIDEYLKAAEDTGVPEIIEAIDDAVNQIQEEQETAADSPAAGFHPGYDAKKHFSWSAKDIDKYDPNKPKGP